eukprot:3687725-Rhodomonas_salina.1
MVDFGGGEAGGGCCGVTDVWLSLVSRVSCSRASRACVIYNDLHGFDPAGAGAGSEVNSLVSGTSPAARRGIGKASGDETL